MDYTIVVEVSEELASMIGDSNKSLLSVFAPYIIALASVLASALIGLFSYKASVNATKTSREIGQDNLKALDKSRYMETISKERTRWIEKVREEFSQYNQKVYELVTRMRSVNMERLTVANEHEIAALDREMRLVLFRISLFLNSTEKSSDIFINKSRELSNYISDVYYARSEISKFMVDSLQDEIFSSQNLILKSEWRRVKFEVKEGREITKPEMNVIFEEVARSLDKEFYNYYSNYIPSSESI